MEFMSNDAKGSPISLSLHPLDGLRMFEDAKTGHRRPSAETSTILQKRRMKLDTTLAHGFRSL
jgi:hypothetical protein